jgi:hypothetical protein
VDEVRVRLRSPSFSVPASCGVSCRRVSCFMWSGLKELAEGILDMCWVCRLGA